MNTVTHYTTLHLHFDMKDLTVSKEKLALKKKKWRYLLNLKAQMLSWSIKLIRVSLVNEHHKGANYILSKVTLKFTFKVYTFDAAATRRTLRSIHTASIFQIKHHI